MKMMKFILMAIVIVAAGCSETTVENNFIIEDVSKIAVFKCDNYTKTELEVSWEYDNENVVSYSISLMDPNNMIIKSETLNSTARSYKFDNNFNLFPDTSAFVVQLSARLENNEKVFASNMHIVRKAPYVTQPAITWTSENGFELKFGYPTNAKRYDIYRKAGKGSKKFVKGVRTKSFRDFVNVEDSYYEYEIVPVFDNVETPVKKFALSMSLKSEYERKSWQRNNPNAIVDWTTNEASDYLYATGNGEHRWMAKIDKRKATALEIMYIYNKNVPHLTLSKNARYISYVSDDHIYFMDPHSLTWSDSVKLAQEIVTDMEFEGNDDVFVSTKSGKLLKVNRSDADVKSETNLGGIINLLIKGEDGFMYVLRDNYIIEKIKTSDYSVVASKEMNIDASKESCLNISDDGTIILFANGFDVYELKESDMSVVNALKSTYEVASISKTNDITLLSCENAVYFADFSNQVITPVLIENSNRSYTKAAIIDIDGTNRMYYIANNNTLWSSTLELGWRFISPLN